MRRSASATATLNRKGSAANVCAIKRSTRREPADCSDTTAILPQRSESPRRRAIARDVDVTGDCEPNELCYEENRHPLP
jgi:hypothetical protein